MNIVSLQKKTHHWKPNDTFSPIHHSNIVAVDKLLNSHGHDPQQVRIFKVILKGLCQITELVCFSMPTELEERQQGDKVLWCLFVVFSIQLYLCVCDFRLMQFSMQLHSVICYLLRELARQNIKWKYLLGVKGWLTRQNALAI